MTAKETVMAAVGVLGRGKGIRQAEYAGRLFMEKIRYLEPQEKQRTRAMYEEIFPEDSYAFVDYYYKWKTRENEILVMEESDMLQVMMHLNPYTLWIHGHLRQLPYIVAVAARPDCRRQGKMRRVMERALQDLAGQQAPFAFLLPADPAYYYGQGFVFFPCTDSPKLMSLRAAGAELFSGEWKKAEIADIPEIAAFSNNILEERYHIFVKRDPYYYQRMLAETGTEHGGILLLKSQGTLRGVLIYGAKRQEAEIQELLLEEDLDSQREVLLKEALPGFKITFGDFRMMLRIASLQEFVSLMKRKETCRYDVKVKDGMICGNCGNYRIEIDEEGGRLQEIPEKNVKRELDIRELAQILLADTRVYLNEWV